MGLLDHRQPMLHPLIHPQHIQPTPHKANPPRHPSTHQMHLLHQPSHPRLAQMVTKSNTITYIKNTTIHIPPTNYFHKPSIPRLHHDSTLSPINCIRLALLARSTAYNPFSKGIKTKQARKATPSPTHTFPESSIDFTS